MNITIRQGFIQKQRVDVIVVNLFTESKKKILEQTAKHSLPDSIQQAIKLNDFTGAFGQTQLHYTSPKSPFKRVLLVGLGNPKKFDLERARRIAAVSLRELNTMGVSSVATTLASIPQNDQSLQNLVQAFTEGSFLTHYRFEPHRSKQASKGVQKITLLVTEDKELNETKRGLRIGKYVSEGTILARNLVNQPANIITPLALANVAKDLAKKNNSMRCRILNTRSLERLGMGALLSVGQGSRNSPHFIIIDLNSNLKSRPLIFVGKGITFDSGGLSLKSVSGIRTMKYDMAGAGAVIGAMSALSNLNLKQRIIALIPTAENMPDGKSFRPGDVVKTLSGKTIEIISTDAEGRLILADALTYAQKFDPCAVIDLATLTGASITALGHHAACLFSSDDLLANRLIKSGEETHEKLWRLPLWPEYRKQIEGEVADLKNSGGSPGGANTAAALLHEFADGYAWAHIDIAGTATSEQSKYYITKGGVGYGVRLLTHFAQTWSQNLSKI